METVDKPLGWPVGRLISAMFLIAGTSVGGGMLALPVSGGRSGFLPSIAVMLVAWLFMTMTGLLYVEVSLWFKGDAHLISMASKLLGRRGKILCWVVYLFIGYASLVAYLSEGGKITGAAVSALLGSDLGKTSGCLLYVVLFAIALILGTKVIGRLNTFLFCCMIAVYAVLVWLSSSQLQAGLLWEQRWQSSEMLSLFPLMLTTFSYPGLVPIVVSSVGRRAGPARLAVVGGTSITFLTYLVWLAVVLGSVPYQGAFGLQAAYEADHSATVCLLHIVKNPWIANLAQAFGFFALTTSFLGLAWALFEFLADGLAIPTVGWGKAWLGALIAGPALLLTLNFEKVFFAALEVSGGVGDALISGMIPAAMVWAGLKHKKYQTSCRLFANRYFLALIMTLGLSILCYEVGRRLLF